MKTRELPAIQRPIPVNAGSRLTLSTHERHQAQRYIGTESQSMSDWDLFRFVEASYPGGWCEFNHRRVAR